MSGRADRYAQLRRIGSDGATPCDGDRIASVIISVEAGYKDYRYRIEGFAWRDLRLCHNLLPDEMLSYAAGADSSFFASFFTVASQHCLVQKYFPFL